MKEKIVYLLFLSAMLISCKEGPTTVAEIAGPTAIQIAVAANDFAVDASRIPFILYDGPEQVTDAAAVSITLVDLTGAEPQAVWSGEAVNYSDYVVPYWIVEPPVNTAGIWGIHADIQLADGGETTAQFTVQLAEETESVAVGQAAPLSQNRILDDGFTLAELSSGVDPDPALYQLRVADAAVSGKPFVVVLATPGFCQTAVCAPVVDSVAAVHEEVGDAAHFIHLEIYQTFNPELILADEVAEWGLASEPWIFVVDRDGVIQARLGGPVSAAELSAALQPLLTDRP